jgi:hypothetical protein
MKKLWKLSRVIAIGAVIMVSAFAVAGCANDSDDGGNDNNSNNGGGGGSLSGMWGSPRSSPTNLFMFTETNDPGITGAKISYYSNQLTQENTQAGTNVSISGTVYPIAVSGNTLTVSGYSPAAAGGAATDVAFKRVEGTSGSTIHGFWVPASLAPGSPQYTLIIIKTGTADTLY